MRWRTRFPTGPGLSSNGRRKSTAMEPVRSRRFAKSRWCAGTKSNAARAASPAFLGVWPDPTGHPRPVPQSLRGRRVRRNRRCRQRTACSRLRDARHGCRLPTRSPSSPRPRSAATRDHPASAGTFTVRRYQHTRYKLVSPTPLAGVSGAKGISMLAVHETSATDLMQPVTSIAKSHDPFRQSQSARTSCGRG